MARFLFSWGCFFLLAGAFTRIEAQSLQVLHSFDGLTNGRSPVCALVEGVDGCFYGVTEVGGTYGSGTIFKITREGTLTTLWTFDGINGDHPLAGLTLASDGNFYGTTHSGGVYGYGNIFRITTNGNFTELFSFNLANGAWPYAALLQEADGHFYGTTSGGGRYDDGIVFRMTTAGVVTQLASFNYYTNGASPLAGLIAGSNGEFYGTTVAGGGIPATERYGTVYKVTTNGVITALHKFTATNGAPCSRLVRDASGNFYGTTSGTDDSGTVFRITPAGEITTIGVFDYSNGGWPAAGVIWGDDGLLYGTTYKGGAYNLGTVFSIGTNGGLATVIHFDNTNGSYLDSELTLGSDGNLYGVTSRGGALNNGTVFRIIMPVSLNVAKNGDQLTFRWPTNRIGFTLQSRTGLNGTNDWDDVASPSLITNGHYTVTHSITDGMRIFRLKK